MSFLKEPQGLAIIPESKELFDPKTSLIAEITRGSLANIHGIMSRASPVESMERLALPYFDFVAMNGVGDTELTAGLNPGFEFTETEVCYVMNSLLSQQRNGEEGYLWADARNPSPDNYFLVCGGLITSLKFGDAKEWRPWHAWQHIRRDDLKRYIGRVFTRR